MFLPHLASTAALTVACTVACAQPGLQPAAGDSGTPSARATNGSRTVHPRQPVLIKATGLGQKPTGEVLIAGQRAWTTTWSDTQVVAYVPETSPMGPVDVQVVSGHQILFNDQLTVEPRRAGPRAAAGSVAWRFEVLANYISHRADLAADGTVYFNDSSGFLYALAPDGALKWIYSGGGSGSQGPTAVGRDGTIYYGTASPSALHAVNPDGKARWVFRAADSQGPIGGPNVGPDGNVYAVFDLPGQMGAVSLTPAGVLRWNTLGTPRVAEYGQVGRELVFGGGNVYFTSMYYGDVHAFELADGDQRFNVNVGAAGQASTGVKGTVYVPTRLQPRLLAFSKAGQQRWSFFDDLGTVTNDLSAPDVGPDGNLYINRNLSQLFSLTPAPAVRWAVDSLMTQGPVNGPIVSPDNRLVIVSGQQTYGKPGLVKAFSTVDGTRLFETPLPKEADKSCAVPYARARFNAAGETAYIPAVQLCRSTQPTRSWLYALDVSVP